MTHEAHRRQTIDPVLTAAGWHVCDVDSANLRAATGVAIREFLLNAGSGFADYLLCVKGKACGVIEAKKKAPTTKRCARCLLAVCSQTSTCAWFALSAFHCRPLRNKCESLLQSTDKCPSCMASRLM